MPRGCRRRAGRGRSARRRGAPRGRGPRPAPGPSGSRRSVPDRLRSDGPPRRVRTPETATARVARRAAQGWSASLCATRTRSKPCRDRGVVDRRHERPPRRQHRTGEVEEVEQLARRGPARDLLADDPAEPGVRLCERPADEVDRDVSHPGPAGRRAASSASASRGRGTPARHRSSAEARQAAYRGTPDSPPATSPTRETSSVLTADGRARPRPRPRAHRAAATATPMSSRPRKAVGKPVNEARVSASISSVASRARPTHPSSRPRRAARAVVAASRANSASSTARPTKPTSAIVAR